MQIEFQMGGKTFEFEVSETFSQEEELEIRTQLIRQHAIEAFDSNDRFVGYTGINEDTPLRVPGLGRTFTITRGSVLE